MTGSILLPLRRCLAIALFASCGFAQPPEGPPAWNQTFIGYAEPGRVTLVWAVGTWDQDWRGMVVKRAPLGPDGARSGEWRVRSPRVIVPQCSAQPDFTRMDTTDRGRKELAARLGPLLESGRIRPFRFDDFRSNLVAASPRMRQAMVAVTASNSDVALLCGLGFRDSLPADQDLIYGLFPASPDGSVADAPLATFNPASSIALEREFKVRSFRMRVAGPDAVLTWSIAPRSLVAAGVRGVQVYRQSPDPQEKKVLIGAAVPPSVRTSDAWRWTWRDAGAMRAGVTQYRLVPYHAFAGEMGSGVVVAVEKGGSAAIPEPEIASAESSAEGVRIQWSVKAAESSAVSGFSVECRREADDRFEPLTSEPLDAAAREIIDTRPWAEGAVTRHYLVRAIAEDGEAQASEPLLVFRPEDEVLGIPTGLSAELLNDQQGVRARLSWKALADLEEGAGYRVYSDHLFGGDLELVPGLPLIREGRCEVPIALTEGRRCTLGVALYSKLGFAGPIARVAVDVPGSRAASIRDFEVIANPASVIEARWSYARGAGLAGFELREGDRLLAGLDQLGPDRRRYRLASLDSGRSHVLDLVAVFSDGRRSPIARAEYRSASDLARERPRRPQSVTAEAVDSSAGKQVRVQWRDDPAVTRYLWSSDLEEFGLFPTAREVRKDARNVVVVRRQDAGRSVTVRIWAENAIGNRSIYSELILPGLIDGKPRSLPPALLPRHQRLERGAGGFVVRWTWHYPSSEQLAGFRIYRDGATNPVADEQTLGPAVRSWTSAPIPRGKAVSFVIEAVDRSGVASERGPERIVLHYRR